MKASTVLVLSLWKLSLAWKSRWRRREFLLKIREEKRSKLGYNQFTILFLLFSLGAPSHEIENPVHLRLSQFPDSLDWDSLECTWHGFSISWP